MQKRAPHVSRKVLVTAASALAIAAGAAPAYGQTAQGQGAQVQGSKGPVVLPAPAPTIPRPPVLTGRPLTNTAEIITPLYGDIEAFWGDINPFYGDIEAFWGDINPFYGDIEAFYGDINPFYGDIEAFYGDIEAFWGDIDPFTSSTQPGAPAYGAIGEYWSVTGPQIKDLNLKLGALGLTYLLDQADYNAAMASLNALVDQSAPLWGAAVTARTGQTFRAGFVDPLLAKYGISLGNTASLQGLTQEKRSRLILDWYDGLMDYSGADHIDWWMGTVNWTPSLTRTQGMAASSVIGLLDSTVAGDPDVANNLTYTGGGTNILNGHGTSVASLMVADHDGRGVMGIAPHASVVAYNPFDLTGTASFQDAQNGIVALKGAGASVINMSLGVNGWTLYPDWKTVFASSGVATALNSTVFVIAAGNSSTVQSANVAWDFAHNPAMILVGSVTPLEQISSFSNQPGMACLTDGGVCLEQNRLYNRFVVAPGELILASDGQGGLMRRSGTSFAAPLVSGAITLLHDRWPWLAQHPKETVDIILRSAKDLGAPGPDPVYGRGLLDVQASQSPLDFNALTYFEVRNGVSTPRTAQQVRTAGLQTSWEADEAFFTLYETIGATQRDFQVPMSSRLVGQKTASMGGAQDYFQTYVHSQLTGWISGTGFSDVATTVAQQPGQWSFSTSASAPRPVFGAHDLAQAPHMAFRMASPSGRFALNAGHGQGAMVLGGMPAFGMTRDYSSAEGGVNPVLGLASGGAFASVDLGLTGSTTLSIGATQRTLEHARNPDITAVQRDMLRNVDDYEAGAFDVRLTQRLSQRLSLSAGWASVREANGLLGVQSIEPGDLAHGSRSDVVDVAASLALDHGVTFAGSVSAGRSRTGGADQNLASDGDVVSSAFAVAMTKQGVVGSRDLVRFSFGQPMHIERGRLAFSSVDVVDRQTGALGVVGHTFEIGAPRRYVAETLYATPVLDGEGELKLFGRAQFQAGEAADDFIAGAAFNVRF